MSANALAIVFAPCILRCHDTIDPLLSVQDIGKTTAYVPLRRTNPHSFVLVCRVSVIGYLCP